MSLFEGGAESWQATFNPVIVWLGILFIFLGKVAAAIMCSMGTWRMWQARSADQADFIKARQVGLAGCGWCGAGWRVPLWRRHGVDRHPGRRNGRLGKVQIFVPLPTGARVFESEIIADVKILGSG